MEACFGILGLQGFRNFALNTSFCLAIKLNRTHGCEGLLVLEFGAF